MIMLTNFVARDFAVKKIKRNIMHTISSIYVTAYCILFAADTLFHPTLVLSKEPDAKRSPVVHNLKIPSGTVQAALINDGNLYLAGKLMATEDETPLWLWQVSFRGEILWKQVINTGSQFSSVIGLQSILPSGVRVITR